jgi:sirohydrochlorin cobaltochelatase
MTDSLQHKQGVVLLAHGSRAAIWKEPFEAIATSLANSAPDTLIAVAYLKEAAPTIDGAVEQMAKEGVTVITVAPMFLAIGAHSLDDFPALAKKLEHTFPYITFKWTEAIGNWEETQQALASTIAARLGL